MILSFAFCLGMASKPNHVARTSETIYCVRVDSLQLKDSVSFTQLKRHNALQLIRCASPSDTLAVVINSYEISIVSKITGKILQQHMTGNRLSRMFLQMHAGDVISIGQVKVRAPNGIRTYFTKTSFVLTK